LQADLSPLRPKIRSTIALVIELRGAAEAAIDGANETIDIMANTAARTVTVCHAVLPISTVSTLHKVKPFEVIHTKLSGKFQRASLEGARYFMSFICQATCYTWARFLKRPYTFRSSQAWLQATLPS
jgi:hypothetical protein